jgi:hypothetical protein
LAAQTESDDDDDDLQGKTNSSLEEDLLMQGVTNFLLSTHAVAFIDSSLDFALLLGNCDHWDHCEPNERGGRSRKRAAEIRLLVKELQGQTGGADGGGKASRKRVAEILLLGGAPWN